MTAARAQERGRVSQIGVVIGVDGIREGNPSIVEKVITITPRADVEVLQPIGAAVKEIILKRSVKRGIRVA